MAQKMVEISPDHKFKKKSPKKKDKIEHSTIENGFSRDLEECLKKEDNVLGDNDENKVIVCNLLPCDMDEIREMDKWLLPAHSLSKYTCAMEGHEYTILIDLEPYSMFINDEKVEPRLSNGDIHKSNENLDTIESPEKDENSHGNDTDLKSYSCNICKVECPCSKKSFQKYKHRWEVAYECDVCLLKVKTGASLVSHMKTHKKKLHHCTLCNKPFMCKASVKRHMRTHYTVNEPHIEPENGIDDMIYNAYTKILRLSKDPDGIESEIEEYRKSLNMEYQDQLNDAQQEIQNEQENQEQSNETKSAETEEKIKTEAILNDCEKAKESLNIKPKVTKPPITLKIKKERLDIGEILKRDQQRREKKRKKQAKERLRRLKRRNRELNAPPLKPEEPTRVLPQRNRKPPPRFNGADVVKEEEMSSDDDLSDDDKLENAAEQTVKSEAEDSDSDSPDEEDDDYNPLRDDPSFYVPKIKIKKEIQKLKIKKEPLSGDEGQNGTGEGDNFDPKEFLASRNKKKPWVCEICGNRYSRRNSLQRHYAVHSMEKPYHCDLCEKSFCMQSYLTAHRKIHFDRRKYKCSECNREFTRQSNLRAHMVVHVDFKPFSCRVCEKRFSHTSNLKRHEILHTGLKLHVCILCGKGFSLPSGLKEHMAVHDENAEPFHCDHCNKDFKEYKRLRRHIDQHVNDKKYKCLCCNRTFHQKTGLKRHLLTHSEAEREATGADVVAKPKDNRVSIIDAPEESLAPVVKDILNHVDIQKINDAVQALDHELQIIKAIKLEADRQGESQIEENDENNGDDSEPRYTVEAIERELSEVAKTVSDLTKSYVSGDFHSFKDAGGGDIAAGVSELLAGVSELAAGVGALSQNANSSEMDTSVDHSEMDTSVDRSGMDTSVDRIKVDTRVNQLEMNISANQPVMDTGVNQLEIGTVVNQSHIGTVVNQSQIGTGVNQLEMNTGVRQPVMNTGVTVVRQPLMNIGVTGIRQPVMSTGVTGVRQPVMNTGVTVVSQPVMNMAVTGVSQPFMNTGVTGVSQPFMNTGVTGVSQPVMNTGVTGVSQPVMNTGVTSVRTNEGYISAPVEMSGNVNVNNTHLNENLISTHWIKKEVLNGGMPVGSCMGNNSMNSYPTLPNNQYVQGNAYPMMYDGFGRPVVQNPGVMNIANYYTNSKFYSNGYTSSEVPHQGANK